MELQGSNRSLGEHEAVNVSGQEESKPREDEISVSPGGWD